jgi:hypothetical protein
MGFAATDEASVQRQLIQRSLSSLFCFFVCSGPKFASHDLHMSSRPAEFGTSCFGPS